MDQHRKIEKFNKFLVNAIHNSNKNSKYSKNIRKSLEICFKYMDSQMNIQELDKQLLEQQYNSEWLCQQHNKHTQIVCLQCLRVYCRQCEIDEQFCDCYDNYQIWKLQLICQKYLDNQWTLDYQQQKKLELDQIFGNIKEDINSLQKQLKNKNNNQCNYSQFILDHQFDKVKQLQNQTKMTDLSEFIFEQQCSDQLQEQLGIQYVDWDYEERLNVIKQKYKQLYYELKSTIDVQQSLFYYQIKNAFDCTYNSKSEINYIQLLNQLKQNYQDKYTYLDICSVQFILMFEDKISELAPTFVSDKSIQQLKNDITALLGYDIDCVSITLSQRKESETNQLFYSYYQANGYLFYEDDDSPIKFQSISGIEIQILEMLKQGKSMKLYIEKCAICQEDNKDNLFFLPCLHYYHVNCIKDHIHYNPRKECPKCKKTISPEYALCLSESYKMNKHAEELQKQLALLINSN